MNNDTYIGFGLALLGSNLCLLLIVLNVLSWINFLHMDLAPIEHFAESILSRWQIHFQTATCGFLIFTLVNILPANKTDEDAADRKKKAHLSGHRRPFHHTVFLIVSVVATLALPHVIAPHRNRHPIIRRSLLGSAVAINIEQPQAVSVNDEEPADTVIHQELRFTVDNMTCGGCGSHVRNLVESTLTGQQRTSPNSFTIDNVQINWRAGVMSIYGTHLTDFVDLNAIATALGKEGYPTSFLYSQ